MRTSRTLLGLAVVTALLSGCEIFQDQRPDSIAFRMTGPPGAVVAVVYSKQFIAAVDELGVTQVRVFQADTVQHTLPIDTIVDVRAERQLFLEALTMPTDTVLVDVQVEVNDRNIFDRSGSLFPGIPWRFLYQFNQRATQDIEVVI